MTRTYAQASRELLRNSLLDGLRGLLLERDWSAVRMSDVAAASGVSRQTVYNEFGSRYGLAQAYAQRLDAHLAAIVGTALDGHPNDVLGALHDAVGITDRESSRYALGCIQLRKDGVIAATPRA